MMLTDTPVNGATYREASRWVPPVVSVHPTEEPVDQGEAKRQCRCQGNPEDFGTWIKAAREALEAECELAICTQTRVQYLDFFPSGPIELRVAPVSSVSSITYTDINGTTQTLSSSLYRVTTKSRPALIIPSYGNGWPSHRADLDSIAVTFVCGYGGATSVPAIIKQALLLKIGSMYQNREMTDEETRSYENLINNPALRWRRF